MNEDEFRKQMNEECGKIPVSIAILPFDGFTLEDHIRHLANWSMPRDSEMAQNEMLVAILLLCREWNRTHR